MKYHTAKETWEAVKRERGWVQLRGEPAWMAMTPADRAKLLAQAKRQDTAESRGPVIDERCREQPDT